MLKLDKKDKTILFALDRNARAPLSSIAKQTRLSRDVVQYRIRRLEQEGLIQQYTTIIDFSRLGYRIVRLYLKLQNTKPSSEEQIIRFFLNQPDTLTVYRIDGYYDLAIGFLSRDLRQYQATYEAFAQQFKPFVLDKQFTLFLDYIHYDRKYLMPQNKAIRSYSVGSHIPFAADAQDIALLNLIKEDARISLLEMSRKLGLTVNGVKYRLKALEKSKVIVAYKLLLDTSKLGYTYYKVDLDLQDTTARKELRSHLAQHPNVVYQDIAVGGNDVEFDTEFPSPEAFQSFMDTLKATFPQIRTSSYYRALKIYKYSYLPDVLI